MQNQEFILKYTKRFFNAGERHWAFCSPWKGAQTCKHIYGAHNYFVSFKKCHSFLKDNWIMHFKISFMGSTFLSVPLKIHFWLWHKHNPRSTPILIVETAFWCLWTFCLNCHPNVSFLIIYLFIFNPSLDSYSWQWLARSWRLGWRCR